MPKPLIYGISFFVALFFMFEGWVYYNKQEKLKLGDEICAQAIVGQKLDVKKLIQKYYSRQMTITFQRSDGSGKRLNGNVFNPDDVNEYLDFTGELSIGMPSTRLSMFECAIMLESGIVVSADSSKFKKK